MCNSRVTQLITTILIILTFSGIYAQKKEYEAIKSIIQQNPEVAETRALQFLADNTAHKNNEYIARANYLLGVINYYQSQFLISNTYYTCALNNPFAKTNPEFVEICYNNKGINHEMLNEFPEALSSYRKSLEQAELVKDTSRIYQTYINIGIVQSRVSDNGQALDSFNGALRYFKKMGDNLNIALCYQNIALIYKDKGNTNEAVTMAHQAMIHHQKCGNTEGVVQTAALLGKSYAEAKNFSVSENYLKQGLALCTEEYLKPLAGDIYVMMAKNRIQQKNYAGVEELFKKAENCYKMGDAADNIDSYYQALADFYVRTGNYEQYRKVSDEYETARAEKFQNVKIERYSELKSIFEYEDNIRRIELQEAALQAGKKQLWYLEALLLVLFSASGVVLYYYLKNRRYLRSLFASNLKQAQQGKIFDAPASANDSMDRQLQLYRRITAYIEEHKPYLTAGLNVTDLSAMMGSNDKYISQAINMYSKSNFNTFVNHYRIVHAKNMMIQFGSSKPIKSISVESGFSNHTTFYRQFKEVTGMSPSQFVTLCDERLSRTASQESEQDTLQFT